MAALTIEPQWLHEETLADLRQTTQRTAILAPVGAGKTNLLNRVVEDRDDLVAVRVATSVDQVERTILDLGAALGPNPRDEAAAALSQHLDSPTAALLVLERALGDRRLVVDDFDALHRAREPRELSDVLAPGRRELSKWLSTHALLLGTSTQPPSWWGFTERRLGDSPGPPWSVTGAEHETQAIWAASSGQNDRCRVALTHWALFGDPPDASAIANIREMIESVWDELPGSVRNIMSLLASYDSMFPAAQFERLVATIDDGEWALEFAKDSLLIEHSAAWYWLSPIWQEWIPRLLEGRALKDSHLSLAQFFARQVNQPVVDPRWFQAAHRHFLRAGELESARDFVRYGVGLLLEAGRGASLDQEFGLAEQYYALVLQLDKQVAPAGVGARNRGYARHYYHYNRYKDSREDIHITQAGYQQAVEEYPENALFWSRLIVARFELGWSDGIKTHLRATQAVQDASAREKYLVGRTVTKLLERERGNAAVVVAGDGDQLTQAKAKSAHYRLERRAQEGWSVDVLRVPGLPDTVFDRTVGLSIVREPGGGYRCRLRECRVDGLGPSMVAALGSAVKQLRALTLELLRTGPEQLSPAQRMRKRELLGLVDVFASAVRGSGPTHRWMTGRIVRRQSGSVFVPLAAVAGEEYPIEPSLKLPEGDVGLVDVKLETGPGGVACGPVVEVVVLFEDDAAVEAAVKQLDEILGT